jgi:hypothetical protein
VFQNFRIAAGLDTGRFRGPSFHDEFYQNTGSSSGHVCVNKDKKLDAGWMKHCCDRRKSAKKDDSTYI